MDDNGGKSQWSNRDVSINRVFHSTLLAVTLAVVYRIRRYGEEIPEISKNL